MKILLLDESLHGVTSLGRALSGKLKLPFFEARDYEFDNLQYPHGEKRTPAERNAHLQKDLGKYSSWIFGGNIINWGDDLFPPFDLIVYLWLPYDMRLEHLKATAPRDTDLLSLFNPRSQSPEQAFMDQLIEVSRRSGAGLRVAEAHEKWLDRHTCPIIEFREDEVTEKFRLQFVMDHIRSKDHSTHL